MEKYSAAILARLGALLDTDHAHKQIHITAADLRGWCLVAQEQAEGTPYARHRHRARWLERDVLAAYENAGYVPMGDRYFVAGLRDAIAQMQRNAIARPVRAEA